jgi:hypothetical protein
MSTPLILTDLALLENERIAVTFRAHGQEVALSAARSSVLVWQDRFQRTLGVVVKRERGEDEYLWVLSPELWERVLWLTDGRSSESAVA